jgi:hypothetical protein
LASFVLAVLSAWFGQRASTIVSLVIVTIIFGWLTWHARESDDESDDSGSDQPRRLPHWALVSAGLALLAVAGLVTKVVPVRREPDGTAVGGTTDDIRSGQSLLVPPVSVESGMVAGKPLPASPSLRLGGAGCLNARARFQFALQGRVGTVRFRAALDDGSPLDAHVQVRLIADGEPIDQEIITRGSGRSFTSIVSGRNVLELVADGLTHETASCTPPSSIIHVFEIVAS